MTSIDDITISNAIQFVDIVPQYQRSSNYLPRVLTVAGSDSSGGAGIEADLKTMTVLGCYGLTCIDALTIQNTTGVKGKKTTDSKVLKLLLTADFASVIQVDVVKIGMLTPVAIDALPVFLKSCHRGKPVVLDTIISSTSGHTFSGESSLKRSIDTLFPLVTLITPNFIEAQMIADVISKEQQCEGVVDVDDDHDHHNVEFAKSMQGVQDLARYLQVNLKCQAVLIKGGHIPWGQYNSDSDEKYIFDILYDGISNSFTIYKDRFTESTNLHGTGCTLASAISCYLAHGLDLRTSVKEATRFVHGSIVYADDTIGNGNGPLNHVWNI